MKMLFSRLTVTMAWMLPMTAICAEPLAITTTKLPTGLEKYDYSVQLSAKGGTAPYTWRTQTTGNAISRQDNSFTSGGTAQGWRGDDKTWLYYLPFDFTYYGELYNKVWVGSNGYLSFSSAFIQPSFSQDAFDAQRMISGCWRDLRTDRADENDIYITTNSNFATFRWDAVDAGDASKKYNFAITLFATGEIRLSYGSGNADGGYAGFSKGGDKDSTIVMQSGTTLNNAQDVVLKRDWVDTNDSVLPYGMTFSQSGVLSGHPVDTYFGYITLGVTDAKGAKTNQTLSLQFAYNSFSNLGANPTQKQIAAQLEGTVDPRMTANITNAATYAAYYEWGSALTNAKGQPLGPASVKASSNAWLSFALDSPTLIESLPKDGDMAIVAFAPSATSGVYDFAVNVAGVTLGSKADADRLKGIFALEGGSSPDVGQMTGNNVTISFGTPVDGQLRFQAGPTDATRQGFFMRMRMTP